MWFRLFPPFSYFTAGPLLLIITSASIPPTAHHFFTFPLEQGMKRELPALFSSFTTPHSLFLHVAMLPPTPPTRRPCRLPSDSWSEGGSEIYQLLSSCDVPGLLFWEGDSMEILACVCAWCVKDIDRYSGVSSFRLSGYFLESKQQETQE